MRGGSTNADDPVSCPESSPASLAPHSRELPTTGALRDVTSRWWQLASSDNDLRNLSKLQIVVLGIAPQERERTVRVE